ncbi:LysR family transcriptional regulator [Methylophaga thalassica]|uniref:LysR family transcriptional regulator n=1 Tax=Methylophaga thalassica TaxID=40223 RepID=A0ABQ5TUM9_9GAMM|nr:LysR family transcriptional regulator [Methylophaga thalassica]GLP99443.1 LysR family transcriptional regulator [Methylophaga thalassica]
MDKLENMKRFVAVVQSGSFTRAADVLGLPKSSVSEAVKSLEQQIKTRLLQRSTRQINLTHDGKIYLEKCLSILEQVDMLDTHFLHPSQLSGTLHIDMPSRFAANIVLPNLHDWYDSYPNINIKLSCHDQRTDLIKDGIDCVIRAGQLEDSSLIARPLLTLSTINCVSTIYADKYGVPMSIEDLTHHVLIDYAQNLQTQTPVFEYVKDEVVHHLPMTSKLQVNSTDAYLFSCLSGLGIAQIPDLSARSYIDSGELIEVLPDLKAPAIPISIVYPSRRQIPKRLSLFMDWLEAQTKKVRPD